MLTHCQIFSRLSLVEILLAFHLLFRIVLLVVLGNAGDLVFTRVLGGASIARVNLVNLTGRRFKAFGCRSLLGALLFANQFIVECFGLLTIGVLLSHVFLDG